MNKNSRPRNRESRTKSTRMDGLVSIEFELTREEWERAQMVMLRHGLSVAKVFRAGLEAVESF